MIQNMSQPRRASTDTQRWEVSAGAGIEGAVEAFAFIMAGCGVVDRGAMLGRTGGGGKGKAGEVHTKPRSREGGQRGPGKHNGENGTAELQDGFMLHGKEKLSWGWGHRH